MAHIIVLARDAREASTYMKRSGLKAGRAVYATSARSIEGVMPSEVHELPRFSDRPDAHAIRSSVLRSTRKGYARAEWLLVEMPEPAETKVEDMGDGMGPQITIEEALAEQEQDIVAQSGDEDLHAVLDLDGQFGATDSQYDSAKAKRASEEAALPAVPLNEAAKAALGDGNGDKMVDEGAPVAPQKPRRPRKPRSSQAFED